MKEITMRTKFYTLFIVVLLVSLLSACSSLAGSTPADKTVTRTMNVTGTGKVTLTPDIAYISIGVHTEGADVTEALTSNTAQAQKVSDALKALGVDVKDIQTTSFNVYPQQQFDDKGQPTTTKYIVDNSVYVTVRDLTKLGVMLDAVVRSGANNINGINFDVSNRDAANSQARTAAIADARKQAEEMAKAAGVTLGDVQSIALSGSPTPTPLYDAKGGAVMSAGASVPVSAGQMIITVDANITYAIK
jgi:uncharacterized protein YggE